MSKPKQIYLFNNERFAIVRPRLVAGLFIRKGSSLPLVEGLGCVCGKYTARVCVNSVRQIYRTCADNVKAAVFIPSRTVIVQPVHR